MTGSPASKPAVDKLLSANYELIEWRRIFVAASPPKYLIWRFILAAYWFTIEAHHERRQKERWAILAKAGVTALCVFFPMLNGILAFAQPNRFPILAADDKPSYCERATLTGTQFIELIHAIVKHGNLTDVAYLERRLSTKFTVSYGAPIPSDVANHIVYYDSNMISGNPIHVTIIDPSSLGQIGGKVDSEVAFQGDHESFPEKNFIKECLHIPASEFLSSFGDDFSFMNYPGGAPKIVAIQQHETSGIHNRNVYIHFGYDPDSKLVEDVEILSP